MKGNLHIGDGPKTRCPKPKVVHYACRHDNGSRKPRLRWTIVRANGRLRQMIVERLPVYKLYCPDCQFKYMQPGCLLWGMPCGTYPDDDMPKSSKEYRRQYNYQRSHSENRTCQRCGTPIADRNQNKSGYCGRCVAWHARQCRAQAKEEAA